MKTFFLLLLLSQFEAVPTLFVAGWVLNLPRSPETARCLDPEARRWLGARVRSAAAGGGGGGGGVVVAAAAAAAASNASSSSSPPRSSSSSSSSSKDKDKDFRQRNSSSSSSQHQQGLRSSSASVAAAARSSLSSWRIWALGGIEALVSAVRFSFFFFFFLKGKGIETHSILSFLHS